ncbi:MAG: phenylalanine--tRNA ligase subunit beta, partial [Candidatus Nealsonbacteria bacterium CG_4_10_14_0_2_um_filter_40_15]
KMVFSYNWLQSFFKKKLPAPRKLGELLTMHFAEVEEVKRTQGDFALDIDVRPNRAGDCFSHLGIAREIAAITGFKLKTESRNGGTRGKKRTESSSPAKDFIQVEVKDKNACPRYSARVVNFIKVGPSPKWLRDRLSVCGLRPINNIVDIANYVMLETGQPLHAFDGEKMKGGKIIVRYAKYREKIVTLDEQRFDLDSDILVIADAEKPVAIAGIKGGKLPEIDKKTKTVIIESANFNSQIIRQGSKKLNLKTDASLRFEHGIDPNLTEPALDRAASLIQKVAGGKIARGLVDVYPKKVFPKIIRLNLDYVESLLGIKIPEKEIRDILESLDFKIKNRVPPQRDEGEEEAEVLFAHKKSKILDVGVPTRRLDVSLPEDLIEEVGRIYGYDKIEAVFPTSSLVPSKRNLDVFWKDVAKDILKEAGFTEVYNYSFFGEREAKSFGYKEGELIEVNNPLSQEQKNLRTSLIPNLLKNVEKNFKRTKEISIFELGKIFKNQKTEGEKNMLSGVLLGDMFFRAKGVIDSLLNKLGISDVWYDEYKPTPEDSKLSIWHPQKCAEIKTDGKEIGFLGEVSPRIINNFDIQGKVVLFDIDFEKLSELASEEHEYRPISRFPSAVRDIAVLVPRFIKVEEVLNKIYDSGGDLIRDVDLFDIYEGEELPQGKKNLAFHIIFQSKTGTLSSEEIDGIQNKIIKILELMPEWQVRK